MGTKINLISKKFGKLTVISESENRQKGKILWNCKCDCGNLTIVAGGNLKNGHTKSCGCDLKGFIGSLNKTHGMYNSRLSRIFFGMKDRCYNHSGNKYKDYGARGITICDEWLDNKTRFFEWALDNGYSDELTIDRINVDGNYCPENCRWTNAKVQANNKRNNKYIEWNGERHTLSEWSEIVGIPQIVLSNRITGRNWTIERAFSQPMRKRRNEKKL